MWHCSGHSLVCRVLFGHFQILSLFHIWWLVCFVQIVAIRLPISLSRALTFLHYSVSITATWEVGIDSAGCRPRLAGPQFSVPFVLSCDTAALGTMRVIAGVTSMHAVVFEMPFQVQWDLGGLLILLLAM